MPFLSNGILERGLGGAEVATYASLGATSVIFGALHAITPAYQVWATTAGFLFGWEYLHDGLGSAMFTHHSLDFIAFAFIVLLWVLSRRLVSLWKRRRREMLRSLSIYT